MLITPEAAARVKIDALLSAAGWVVQPNDAVNLHAGPGVAVCEFPLKPGHGTADYLLFVNGRAAGVVEAKKEGSTLTGVETQSAKYGDGLPDALKALARPLPFLYESTGVETRFTNRLDPEPRSRPVFAFHRPETLAAWAGPTPLVASNGLKAAEDRGAYDVRATLRRQLRDGLPTLNTDKLWPAQIRAVEGLEESLAKDKPRALIQMATGSGKTFTAITSIYRLIKYGGAQRVLFLVDRGNLGRQTLKEFQQYVTPDDGRKFTELYNVQHLQSNRIDPVARVCICTIQRLYSMLRGDAELDPDLEEGSAFDSMSALIAEPAPISFNPEFPIETFDFIFTDECHRSIYNLWRQVLEYFDSYLIGLTATPSKQTFGFFNQNLVMEYGHEQAVADGVNVGYDIYNIRTKITESGSTVEADFFVDRRDRLTREVRWEKLEDDLSYTANQLDRDVVAIDQIRTIIRTFRERLPTEIFPGRTEVPKTLIFAKDDSHADDIVRIVREEFGRGNDFCQKITYRTTGAKPEELLAAFRNSFYPRIVVTVDMIATGTDIKPLEIVMFLRAVKSRNFFEQMKGRGVRIVSPAEFGPVSEEGAPLKDHFVLIDCVGVTENELSDTPPLEKKRTLAFDKLLTQIAYGSTDADTVSSLASRLARLDRHLGKPEQAQIVEAAGGMKLGDLVSGLLDALDPDRQQAEASLLAGLPPGVEPTGEQLAVAKEALIEAAVKPLAANPALRNLLVAVKQRHEQTIDHLSQDELTVAAFSIDAKERAAATVASFRDYIEANRDEITALQLLYNRPYANRLRLGDIKALAAAISAPPRSWTPDRLWTAYETLDKSRVRGSGTRTLTDIISIIRFTLGQEAELDPFADEVNERYQHWLAMQESRGRHFTPEQRRWLDDMRDHIATSLHIERDDFDYTPFEQNGGLGKVYELFGDELNALIDELNEVLVA